MLKQIIVAFAVLLAFMTQAQKANVKWGEEFKIKRGSEDLQVIHSDPTGIYAMETHTAMKGLFKQFGGSASLIKLDKNLEVIYSNDYNKELKGKEFDEFFVLKNKLFLMAGNYTNKKSTYFGVEIDKTNGKQIGEWQEFASREKEDKSDNLNHVIGYNSDSTQMIMVSSIEGKAKVNFQVQSFNENLKEISKPISVTNDIDPKTFDLEEVLYTKNGNIVMIGKVYEYETGKKEKTKYLQFSNYNIRLFDNKGKQIQEISTEISGKWLVTAKIIETQASELVLAAFYSNTKKGREINGMLVQRININTGAIISTSQKDINTTLISNIEKDNGINMNDDKEEIKEREKMADIKKEEEGFSKYMRFRNIIYTADKGIVILAERFDHYTHSSTTYTTSQNGQRTSSTTTYHVYESGDLMMCKIDMTGNIKWLNILPKDQTETMIGSAGSLQEDIGLSFFRNNGNNAPFYSGFGVLNMGSNINIILNDNQKNDQVSQPGQKIKAISSYRNSDCFLISLDPVTGKYSRSRIFTNSEIPTAMPRLGTKVGNEFYLIGKEDRMYGKPKIVFGKITIK